MSNDEASARTGPEAASVLDGVARAALAAARADRTGKSCPNGLRPYLRFKRLKPPAVRAVVRVLDGEEEFRQHLAETGDEAGFGPAAWLWLTRPDGWMVRFDQLIEAQSALGEAQQTAREERSATRRLAVVQQACDDAQARVGELEGELAAANQRAKEEAAERTSLAAEVASARQEAEQARKERERAVRQLKDTEALLSAKVEALRAATADMAGLEERLAREEAAASPGQAVPAGPDSELANGADAASAGGDATPGFDPAAVSQLAAFHAAEAERLARELARLASILGGREHMPEKPNPGPVVDPARSQPRRPLSTRRAPKLPPGLHDDSSEAARFWCSQSDAVLCIDGYNVSMLAWPAATTTLQRQRLERRLGEWVLRWGSEITIFWDGVDDGAAPQRVGSGALWVEFTKDGVEADDAIIERVGQLDRALDPDRLIVVVSSDGRVRAGVRAQGAATVSSARFLEVLGI